MRKKTRYIINIILSVVLFFNILTVSACAKQTTESSSNTSSSVVDDVGKVSGFMNEYGPTVVILSLFILMAAGMFGAFIYMLKSSNKVILDQQKKLLDTILDESKKKKSSPDKKEDDKKKDIDKFIDPYHLVRPLIHTEENLVEIFVKLNETIHESVVELRRSCDADRVSVYVFHNGSYSSHGLPFFKFTCINEKIKKYSGMTPKIHIHNGLPLTMYGSLIADIYRNGEIIYEDVEDIREKSPILYGEFVDQGVKSAIANAIYDSNDNILGIILTEFVKHRDIDGLGMLKPDIINTIKHLAPVLSYASYQHTDNKKGDD